MSARSVRLSSKKAKSKCFQRTRKCGLGIPKTWKEALAADKENGDHLWEDAIRQEMKNSRVAFEECDGDIKSPVTLFLTQSHQNALEGKRSLLQMATKSQPLH